MQSREFDNLMNGDTAKFAEMFKTEIGVNNVALAGLLAKAKQVDATDEDIQEARSEIEKNEVEIPGPLRFKMDMFIQAERAKGTKERTIRRLVQKKFNIQVV